MKKLLLILTFLISSVFFISNVNAEAITIDYVTLEDLNTQINFVSQINNFNTNNTYNTNLVNFITSGDYLEYGQYYYIAGSSTYNGNVLYVSDNPNFLKISGNAYLIKASQKYPVYKYNSYSNTKEYIYEDIVSTTRTPVYLYYKNMDGKSLMATNVNEIYLTEDTAFYFSKDDVRFEPSSLFYVNDGTKLHLSTHYSAKPSIDISKEHETSVTILEKEYVTDVTLNVKFSSINNDKYLYQYKFIGENEGLWTTKTLENDNFSVKFNENGTLIVRIIDKETNEDVTSANFAIGSINYDLTPYIEIDYITDDGCILEDYTLCTSLRINSHIADFNRYRFIIMDHGQNVTEEYKEMTIWKTYYMNTSITIRIVDRTTGTYVDEKHISIISISEETENLGHHIEKSCEMSKIGTHLKCRYYVYNYNPDKYRYYYGTSTKIFKELSDKVTNDAILIIPFKDGLAHVNDSYTENTTVYFEIKDKETNEVVYTKTFRVNYDKQFEESGKKNLFDIFKNFRDENSSIKKLLEDMWNSIKNSSIYEYIFILIVGTLIVLIIKAANR